MNKQPKLLILIIFISTMSLSIPAYTKEDLKDPFIPPQGFRVKEKTEEEKLEELMKKLPFKPEDIQGVVMENDKKYVIINNQIVQQSDKFQGLIIEIIEKDHLVVIFRKRKITLPFKKKGL